jgi:hypothetical protein
MMQKNARQPAIKQSIQKLCHATAITNVTYRDKQALLCLNKKTSNDQTTRAERLHKTAPYPKTTEKHGQQQTANTTAAMMEK